MKTRKCKILELLSERSFSKKELLAALQITEADLEIRLGILLSENSIIHKQNAYEITERGKSYLQSYHSSFYPPPLSFVSEIEQPQLELIR